MDLKWEKNPMSIAFSSGVEYKVERFTGAWSLFRDEGYGPERIGEFHSEVAAKEAAQKDANVLLQQYKVMK